MAFTTEKTEIMNAEGRLKKVIATFTNTSGSTGGAIVTGLNKVLHANITHTGATVVASAPVYADVSGTVTIKTVADADGTIEFIGV